VEKADSPAPAQPTSAAQPAVQAVAPTKPAPAAASLTADQSAAVAKPAEAPGETAVADTVLTRLDPATADDSRAARPIDSSPAAQAGAAPSPEGETAANTPAPETASITPVSATDHLASTAQELSQPASPVATGAGQTVSPSQAEPPLPQATETTESPSTGIPATPEPAQAPPRPDRLANASLPPSPTISAQAPTQAEQVSAASDVPASLDPRVRPDSTADMVPHAPDVVALASEAPSEATSPTSGDKPQVAAIVAPPRPDALAIDPAQEIETVVTGYGCARINAHYDISGGIVLSGHVKSDVDRANMLTRLESVPGVHRVDDANLHIVGEPYCRVLAFLGRPEFVRSSDQRVGMAEFGNPAQSDVKHLSAGMPLEIAVRAPDFPSYVYVDYFSVNGKVYHLLPVKAVQTSKFEPGKQFVLGGNKGAGFNMTVAAPFGLDFAVAIASTEPLFHDLRPLQEDASDYLKAVAGAIERLKQAGTPPRLEYAYWLIYTTAGAPAVQ
jgi:hypothetical protein